jgi:hypothetical protein
MAVASFGDDSDYDHIRRFAVWPFCAHHIAALKKSGGKSTARVTIDESDYTLIHRISHRLVRAILVAAH